MYDRENLEYEPGPVGESYSRVGPPARDVDGSAVFAATREDPHRGAARLNERRPGKSAGQDRE